MGRPRLSRPVRTHGLRGWLRKAGLSSHAEAFRDARIALDQVSALTDVDLRELGLPLGDRMRFRQAIARDNPAPDPEILVAEHRPLTIAFFDLVDSTVLAERSDPETFVD